MSKIAIVIGHNRKAQGAVRVLDGRTEFDWNSQLAQLIQQCDPDNVALFERKPLGGYRAQIDEVYGRVSNSGALCSIELHFNSWENPAATGCLTLSSGTQESLALAHEVHPRMHAVMGNEDDGIEIRGRRARGGRSLWQGKPPAIMVEPYFGSHERFCAVADAHMDELAEAIYEGASAFIQALQLDAAA